MFFFRNLSFLWSSATWLGHLQGSFGQHIKLKFSLKSFKMLSYRRKCFSTFLDPVSNKNAIYVFEKSKSRLEKLNFKVFYRAPWPCGFMHRCKLRRLVVQGSNLGGKDKFLFIKSFPKKIEYVIPFIWNTVLSVNWIEDSRGNGYEKGQDGSKKQETWEKL